VFFTWKPVTRSQRPFINLRGLQPAMAGLKKKKLNEVRRRGLILRTQTRVQRPRVWATKPHSPRTRRPRPTGRTRRSKKTARTTPLPNHEPCLPERSGSVQNACDVQDVLFAADAVFSPADGATGRSSHLVSSGASARYSPTIRIQVSQDPPATFGFFPPAPDLAQTKNKKQPKTT